MPSLVESAIQYAELLGWPVFPVRPSGKTPLTPRGFHDASSDPALVRTWWQRWPDANIGVPAGEVSGFVVIDIDAKSDGPSTLAELVELHGAVPTTVQGRTGGGGAHYLFKHPGGKFRNTAGVLGRGIDTRGDGGYIVVPPSLHPSGTVYEWQRDPFSTELAELPAWLVPPAREAAAPPPVRMAAPSIVGEDERIRRATAYLDAMDPSISGAGGHAKAYAAATALVHGFDLSSSVARQLFASVFNPRCQPPWSDREIDHKIAEAARKPHDNPRGWLLAAGTLDGDQAHGREVADAILTSAIARASADIPPMRQRELMAMPADLMEPPGYIGELCRWINETAYKPQPILTLGTVLAFFGSVIGRKVKTPTDLRSNLYCLGVGRTGCGKNHSRIAIKRLCDAAGLTEKLLGGEEVASDSAILSAVAERPAIFFLWDEIGHMIAAANSRNAQSHVRGIPVTLTKLFTSANSTVLGKEYADRKTNPRRDIIQPNVGLYGTTTPGKLFASITPDEISDGFLGRMLVFMSENPTPERRRVRIADVPKSLVELAQAWWQRDDLPRPPGNIAGVTQHAPLLVPFQDDALIELEAFEAETDQKIASRGSTDELGLDALWVRASEHAQKVALVITAGCEFASPVVTRDVLAWSIRLIRYLTVNLIEHVAHQVSATDYGRDLKRVLAVIHEAGEINRSSLMRRTQGMDPKRRDLILNELVQSDHIAIRDHKPKRGRPATFYRAIGGADAN